MVDNNISRYFNDRIQESISSNDAVALEKYFKKFPKFCRHEVISGAFRYRTLFLLKSSNIKWTDPNIHAIQKLLQNKNLKWRGDEIILSLELISQSKNYELMEKFPELL